MALNDFIIIYFDDIFVYSKAKKKHIKYVKYIFQELQEYDL